MMQLFDLFTWPDKYRKAFVLLLPISVPVYLLAVAVSVFTLTIGYMLICPLYYIVCIWKGRRP
jgi:hypothetical protein